jgi:3'-5' exoribonuclease
MKEIFVRDAERLENQTITTSFLVVNKQLKPKKTGEPYLDLLLTDNSGQLPAKMWDNVTEASARFEVDDVIKVSGVFGLYNKRWQFTIRRIEGKIPESEIDFGDFLPKTGKDIDAMWAELQATVAALGNPHLKSLLGAFLGDEEIARGYRNAPAAKTMHHAFIGGLLEHVVSLCNIAKRVAPNYPNVDLDLLLAGVVLHDIGKVKELTYARSFSYTTEGQLLGHMMIELDMLRAKVATVADFPPKLLILLEHLIISHHGQYAFGSSKLPMFPEALLLHYLDDMDSKMEAMRAQIESGQESGSEWAGYNRTLERSVLNRKKFLDSAE